MSIRSFFNRFRRPRYVPPVGDGSCSNWSTGDLAVHVGDPAGWTNYDTGTPSRSPPGPNEVWCVDGIAMHCGFQMLHFVERPVDWWTARSFRKAIIDKNEACAPDFAKLLKRSTLREPA